MFIPKNTLYKVATILCATSILNTAPLSHAEEMTTVRVTVTNVGPNTGSLITPPWIAFHDGGFDVFDSGAPASGALESIAEDGNAAPLSGMFMATGMGIDAVLNDIGPIAPGASVSRSFRIDGGATPYFSYTSMVIPSNDAFIANDDPMAYPVFDDDGTFIGADFTIAGTMVYDAGTESNDEAFETTAALGQMAPNTGSDENGVIQPHPGLMAAGNGGVVDTPQFAMANFATAGVNVARIQIERVDPDPVTLRLTFENPAPANGTFLTPIWIGFHDGTFDFVNVGEAAFGSVEALAEDGNTGLVENMFSISPAAGMQRTVVNEDGGPVYGPGASQTITLSLDRANPNHQYLSFASMIIPSNDAFIANDNPTAYPMFHPDGSVNEQTIQRLGAQIYDAGTELNTESAESTAFFGQAEPNTGTDEQGVIGSHPGFLAPGMGGILDDAMFAGADFTAPGYQAFRLTIEEVEPDPVTLQLTFQNRSPENGTFLTPVWIGVHDGTFDFVDVGQAALGSLERIAEDGATGPLEAMFSGSIAGGLQATVANTTGGPVYGPGASETITLELDRANPRHQYLSFASMVIPSNDAFIANDNPMAYPLFDENGNINAQTIRRLGSQVYDAGTEANTESSASTAFFGQATPNTGDEEQGVVAAHPGFLAAGSGGVLDDAMFAAADFTAPGYELFELHLMEALTIHAAATPEGGIRLSWTGGEAPFVLESRALVDQGEWTMAAGPLDEREIELFTTGTQNFYRVVSLPEPAPATARYRVTFDATWSSSTHPMQFPPNPHFSGLIGATHNSSVQLWDAGSIATQGIEIMAETGGKSSLMNEVNGLIGSGAAESVLSGNGIPRSPGSVSLEFTLSQDAPLVSLVSMIAPSPDWFVGVHDLPLYGNNAWVDELSVPLQPYDAGTDSGTAYTSSNADTNPQEPIFEITGAPFLNNGAVPALGTFTFTRLE